MLVLITPSLFSGLLIQDILFNTDSSDSMYSNPLLLIIIIAISAAPIFLIYLAKLDTHVRDEGLFIKFRPFHRRWVMLPFHDIAAATEITYKPLKDYGGWGIRYGPMGKAYNVSGNKGVLLEFEEGPSILIGSNNSEVLCSLINSMVR
tara:strand:+ start:20436 stop:20879 length:444 start_codon:yes stop_codon:yes gene_type:complete